MFIFWVLSRVLVTGTQQRKKPLVRDLSQLIDDDEKRQPGRVVQKSRPLAHITVDARLFTPPQVENFFSRARTNGSMRELAQRTMNRWRLQK